MVLVGVICGDGEGELLGGREGCGDEYNLLSHVTCSLRHDIHSVIYLIVES